MLEGIVGITSRRHGVRYLLTYKAPEHSLSWILFLYGTRVGVPWKVGTAGLPVFSPGAGGS